MSLALKRHPLMAVVMCMMFVGALALAGCGGQTTASSSGSSSIGSLSTGTASADSETSSSQAEQSAIDYLVLVNKQNKLPDGWEEALQTVTVKNTVGDDVEVEQKAYDAYLELKAELEKEGVQVDMDSARRSVAEQQEIVDNFTVKYGEDYVKQYVAVPGFSEHHTGLAIDLYLIIDGKDVVENEDLVTYPEIWSKIHAKLADHGFILRYLEGKEDITGYSYEPWHIRYLDSAEIAHEITDAGETLEEYLGVADEAKAANAA